MNTEEIASLDTIQDRIRDTFPDDAIYIRFALVHCHISACKLDLERLAKADNSNFWHDVYGIFSHWDIENEQLTNCFLPRFAVRE